MPSAAEVPRTHRTTAAESGMLFGVAAEITAAEAGLAFVASQAERSECRDIVGIQPACR